MLATTGLRGGAVVVRNDAAKSCLPFDLALVRRAEINIKNIVADLLTLMGPREVVMRQPFTIDMVKMINAQADKVVKALCLYCRNVRFRVSVRLRGAWRSFHDLRTRTFPEGIETRSELSIPIPNQMLRLLPYLSHPYGCVSRLLKNPFFIGMKCRRGHEHLAGVEMDEYENVGINLSLPRQHGLGEKVDSDQSFNVRGNEPRPGSIDLAGCVKQKVLTNTGQ